MRNRCFQKKKNHRMRLFCSVFLQRVFGFVFLQRVFGFVVFRVFFFLQRATVTLPLVVQRSPYRLFLFGFFLFLSKDRDK